KVILVIGNMLKENPFKDYKTVTHAISRLNDSIGNARTVVVTLGGEKGHEVIGDIPIYHFPFVSDEKKIASYYRAADVYIQSSRTDNFPTTVLEAFSCGIPVIGTAVGGIVEQIQDGANGYLVPPHDPEGMAHKIEQILQDQELQKRMSIQARKTAVEHYDIKGQTDAYLAFFSEILDHWKSSHEQTAC
ncbi:MAG: glycosyltransferase, partial [Anaerolineaceae bacterium]